METARIIAHNSGKSLLPNTYITFEEVLPVHHQNHDDSTNLPYFQVEQGVSLRLGLCRTKTEDGEIDVFSAEKYFNGDIVTEGVKPKLVAPVKKELESTRTSYSETSKACSESSINSRSLLLQVAAKKDASPSQGIPRRTRRFFDVLQYGCSCFSSKSINVKGNGCSQQNSLGSVEQIPDKSKHDEVNRDRTLTAGRMPKEGKSAGTPKVRFNSPICKRQDVKGLTMLSLSQRHDSITSSCDDHDDGHCRSESSSELFEIEPFTKQYPHLLQKASRLSTNPTCYDPSKASIRWSVTTASAIDFSEWDEESPHVKKKYEPRLSQQPGIFLHCTSDRAVDVSSTAYRLPEKVGVGMSRPVELGGKRVPAVKKYDVIGNPIDGFELCR